MDLDELEKLIQLGKKEGIQALSYKDESKKIKIDFYSQDVVYDRPLAREDQRRSGEVDEFPENEKFSNLKEEVPSGVQFIKSPFVGTFYRSPAPSEPVYTNVGQKVQKGQVLCVLEAMKIMNEIESDASGEIIEICAENESLVEYGQVLFKVKAD